MIPLPPSLSSAPAATAATPAAPLPTTALPANPAQIPPELTQLPVAAKIDAQVLALLQPGLVQVETPQGSLDLKLPLPVPPDAQLTLLVTAQGAQPQFRLVAINGQPVAANGQMQQAPSQLAPQQTAFQTPLTMTAAASPPDAPPQMVPAGIRATVLKSPPVAADQPQPTSLPPGTGLTLRIASVQMPETLSQPQQLPIENPSPQAVSEPEEPPTPQAGQQEAAPEADSAQSSPQPLTKPQTQATVTVTIQEPVTPNAPQAQTTQAQPQAQTQAQPQAQPPASPPALSEGDVLTGTVAPNSRPSSPLIQTPVGTLSLEATLELPPGAQVVLQLVAKPDAPPAPDPQAKADTGPAKSWPGLEDGLDQLRQKAPQLAESLSRHLPQITSPRLAAQLFSLVRIASARADQQTLASALLQSVAKEERHAALQLLEDQPIASQEPMRLPGSGDDLWRSYTLPLQMEDRWEKLRLVVRDRPEGGGRDDPDKPEQGTRFLIDLDMTHLGPVQLDGLVKGRAKRFDLIIRTHDALATPLQSGITEVFTRTLDGFGMTGKTSFVATRQFVEPFPNWNSPPITT